MKLKIGTKSLVKLGKLGVGILSLLTFLYFIVVFVIPAFSVPQINTAQTSVASIYPNTLIKNGTAQQVNFTVTLMNNPANVSMYNVTILIPASGSALNFTVTSGSNVSNTTGWTSFFLGNSTPTTPTAVMFNASTAGGLTGNTSIIVGLTVVGNTSLTTDNATQAWNVTVGDNSTTFNSTFVYAFIASQSPRISNSVPGNTTYIKGTATQLFNMTVADQNLNLTNASLHFKVGSGAWNNTFASNATGLTCTGTAPNFGCSGTANLLAGGAVNGATVSFFFEASDNATNYASNGTLASPLTVTVVTNPPVLGNNTPLPANPNGTQYSPGKSYTFNVTASDALSGVNTVLFEFNNTTGGVSSTLINSTGTLVAGTTNNYSYTVTDLPAGIYQWKWYANDSVQPSSDTNWANTSQSVFNVSVNQTNPVNLFFNATQNANGTYTYPASSGVVVQSVYSSSGNVNIFRNGVSVATGASPQSFNVSEPNATITYLANASGNANYTANATGITLYALINKGTTTVTLLLNGTAGNMTIVSNSAVNATTTVDNSQGNLTLWKAGALYNSSITLTNIQNTTLFTGTSGTTYNMTAFYATTQNYSSSSATWYVIIESGAPTWSSLASNLTNASTIGKFGNGTILISAQWNEDYALNNYWFSNNTSGSFVNDSAVAFAAGNWTNISFNPNIVNITAGNAVVQMLVYGNDTSGNQNATQTFLFTINGVAPAITSPSPANNSYNLGTSTTNFSVSVNDPVLNSSNVSLYYRSSGQSIWPNNVSLTCTGTSPSYFCSKLVDLTPYGDNTTVQYLFSASDGSQLSSTSGTFAQPFNTTIDKQSPKYFNVLENGSASGLSIGLYSTLNLSAQFTDSQNLSYAVIETNESGSAANKTVYGSPFALSGGTGPQTVSFTWTNSSVAAGTTVSWRVFVNDTAGNQNVTGYLNFTVNGNSPQVFSVATNTTNNTAIVKGAQINVSALWNDSLSLSTWWVQVGTNTSITNSTPVLFTASNVSNYTINTSAYPAGTQVNATIFANNSANVQNNTRNANSFFLWTIDNLAPQYFSNTSSAVVTYGNGQSNFTVTWTDDIAPSTGLLQSNFSGSFANYTMTNSVINSTASAFSYNLTLPAGTFLYQFLANDTTNNFNSTPNFTVTVLKGNVTLNVTLNATNGNNTYTYPQAVNATAWSNATIGSEGNLSLYRNGAIVSSSASDGTVGENLILPNASTNYTALFTATNYSTSTLGNVFAIVNKGAPLVTLLLNGTAANYTTQQGGAINFTATVNTSYNVLLNLNTSIAGWGAAQNNTGTSISNVTSTTAFNGTNFNATAWFAGDANYTSSSQSYFFNVTQDVTPPTITISAYTNGTIRKYGGTFNINITATDTEAITASTCNVTIAGVSATNLSVSGSGATVSCNGTVTVPSSGLGSDGNKTINITIADPVGNVGKNDSFVLTLENTPPVLTVSVPLNGTYNKSLGGMTWVNGTIYDLLGMGVGNVTLSGSNSSSFALYSFTGANNSAFAVKNSSSLSDGNYSVTLTYNNSANDTGQIAVSFFVDNTPPTTVVAVTNSSSGKYLPNSSQQISFTITGTLQTNATAILSLFFSRNSSWSNYTVTGTPGTSTTYNMTLDTSSFLDNEFIKYYVAGIDNATNTITSAVGGSSATPLANLTIDYYCGNGGSALSFCSRTQLYDFNWRSLFLPPANVVQNWTSLSSNFTVPNALSSISSSYNYVYYYNGTSWQSFNPSLSLAQNDLKIVNNTNNNPYWVNMTSPGIVRIS